MPTIRKGGKGNQKNEAPLCGAQPAIKSREERFVESYRLRHGSDLNEAAKAVIALADPVGKRNVCVLYEGTTLTVVPFYAGKVQDSVSTLAEKFRILIAQAQSGKRVSQAVIPKGKVISHGR